MERASHPSRKQVEALIEYLEKYPNLAKGFPKVPSDRDACRKAWEGLTIKLNDLGGNKTLKQWMKYWADKKSAVKKKVSLRSKAKNKTGGEFEPVMELSELEERIVALLNVESSSIGNKHTEINPLPELTSLSPTLLPDTDNLIIIPAFPIEKQHESPTPSVIYVDVLSPTAEVIQSSQEDPPSPRIRSPSPIELTTPSVSGKYPGRRRLNLSSAQANSTSSGSQRSRSHRDSESQQRSQFFYLTEQIVKLEKQRMELERRNSDRQAESNLATAKALSAIGEGLKMLAGALNKMSK